MLTKFAIATFVDIIEAFKCADHAVLLKQFRRFKNKRTHTHTHTHAHTHAHPRALDNLQYDISTEWNILKCAHDFLKCMLCFAYPTIILELKSKKSKIAGTTSSNLSSKIAGIPTTFANMLGTLGNADDDHRCL